MMGTDAEGVLNLPYPFTLLKNNKLSQMEAQPKELLGLTCPEVCSYLESLGEKPFHGKQIYRALYAGRKRDFSQITELSSKLREKLSAGARIGLPEVSSSQLSVDGTEKYLFKLVDRRMIESVFIPEEHRNTLCISTQVGCAMACEFCLTALMGFARNLTAGEIVGQILFILGDRQEKYSRSQCTDHPKPTNIVLMGMGEPLLNFNNLVRSVVLMADPQGLAISPHRVTVSTVGVVPNILRLAQSPVIPNLAVSLSATTDEVRNRLMPINKRFPIPVLLEACAQFPLAPRSRLTFEYVLIDQVNDSDADARRLVRLLSPIRSKVNLLPLNLGKDTDLRPSLPERMLRFQQILVSKGLPAYIRRPRGADIFAACGQLHRSHQELPFVH